MKRAVIALSAALAAALSWPQAAHAADAHVELQLEACSELSESALREHLAIELATLGLDAEATHLTLRCEQGAVAIQVYRVDGTLYPIASRVALGDTARGARERLVALAASELTAQAAREEREARAAREAQTPKRSTLLATPPIVPERDEAPPRPRNAPRRVELSLGGSGASTGSPRTWLWGGVLGARFGVGERGSVVVDVALQRGSERVELAEVRWTKLDAFAGGAVGGELGPLRLSGGLGVRAGWLTLAASAASPNTGQSLTAPWAGPALPLRLALATGASVLPFVAGEAGYVALPVRGRASDGRLLLEQRGFWLGGSVGLLLEL
ncbi:MAG TPA: hypothetical protein VHB79_29980 [Polyangiaceae bacterium]|nr:hypothetical protein [Polyangiaceae bacterium]